uniref:Lipoprotein n=1 Tax=uncultured bacterium contig00059 TaxID=1181542 RepID=A0A0A6ZH51_9BACT|nr:hypothetical protein [uncultured bacterium contig00059]
MKIKIPPVVFYFCVIVLCLPAAGCAGKNKNVSSPVPGFYEELKPDNSIDIGNIVESKNGHGNANLPLWLLAYIRGGIEEIEKMEPYIDKYCFVGRNEGGNFEALNKWAGNYSVTHDFSRLAALRIEKKLISSAALYPDDEYGHFYEKLVKKAFDAEYPSVLMEGTYWIKKETRMVLRISMNFLFYQYR